MPSLGYITSTYHNSSFTSIANLQGVLEVEFVLEGHAFVLSFVVSPFLGLQIEPRVRKRFHLGQQGFDEGVVLVLGGAEEGGVVK